MPLEPKLFRRAGEELPLRLSRRPDGRSQKPLRRVPTEPKFHRTERCRSGGPWRKRLIPNPGAGPVRFPLLAVGTGLYLVACRCHEREVICIAADTIRIERGRRKPEQSLTLTRAWARVVLKACPRQWYPSRLLIRVHGQTVEVGRFLVEEERRQLAEDLNRCLCVNP